MGGSRREAAGIGAAQKGKGMIRHLVALAALGFSSPPNVWQSL